MGGGGEKEEAEAWRWTILRRKICFFIFCHSIFFFVSFVSWVMARDRLFEEQDTFGRYDWQHVIPMEIDQMADTLERPIFRAHLCQTKGRTISLEKSKKKKKKR